MKRELLFVISMFCVSIAYADGGVDYLSLYDDARRELEGVINVTIQKRTVTCTYQGPEDGNGVYTYQVPGSWLDGLRVTRRADGYRKFEYSNGVVYKRKADGSEKYVYPNGFEKHVRQDGVVEMVQPSAMKSFVCKYAMKWRQRKE